MANSRVIRDLGGRVVSAPASAPTVFDQAIVEADPADGLDVMSLTPIEGNVQSMYLVGDRVMVLSSIYRNPYPYDPMPILEPGLIDVAMPMVAWWGRPDWRREWIYQPPQVKVTILEKE